MSEKSKIDSLMKNVVVEEELKNKILNQTVRKKRSGRFRVHTVRRVAAAAIVAVVLIGSVSAVAAGVLGRWDEDAAEHFGVNKREQKTLSEKGYAKNLQDDKSETDVLTATDNGITITAKQTLVDDRALHIYFRIKSTKGVKLNVDEQWFQKWEVKGASYNSKVGEMEDLQKNSDYEKGLWIHAGNSNGESNNIIGKTIRVRLKNLMSEDSKDATVTKKILVKGEWNFSWKVTGCNKSITIPLNRTIKQGKNKIHLEKMQLSPLSYKIDYTLVSGDADTLESIFIIWRMKDGTEFSMTEDDNPNGTLINGFGEIRPNGQTEFFDTNLLDVENLKSIVIGDEEFVIE